jgi:hypothetical protein
MKLAWQNAVASVLVLLVPVVLAEAAQAREAPDVQFLRGRVVAVGIPGASSVSPVGQFLPGGPFMTSRHWLRLRSRARSSIRRAFWSPAARILRRCRPAPTSYPARFSPLTRAGRSWSSRRASLR